VAVRFAKEGLPVGLVARSSLGEVAAAVEAYGVPVVTATADAGDEESLRAALDAVADRLGPPDVLVYNAAVIRPDAPGELSTREHLDTWAVNVLGAHTAAAHVLPGMAGRGRGTFLVTGGMPEPKPEYLSLSLGKAGVRALVGALDQAYRPAGVHVASVTVAGAVAPGTDFDPDDIAEHYWRLHVAPPAEWVTEVVHSGRISAGPVR
jgi:NAD(P)-dependent dehydrogenase (short-subunit alcohol dehydrogenase family)